MTSTVRIGVILLASMAPRPLPAVAAAQTAPMIAAQPQSVTIAQVDTARFTVVATGSSPLTYRWEQSTDGTTWTGMRDWCDYEFVNSGCHFGPYIFGSARDTLSVSGWSRGSAQFRCVVSNSSGSVTSRAATMTVTSAVKLSRTSLRFVATRAPGSTTISRVTQAQNIAVTIGGTGVPWIAVAPSSTLFPSFLKVSGGSGRGGGQFTVEVATPLEVAAGVQSMTETVNVGSPSGNYASVEVDVTLTIITASTPAFGSFDTPAGDGTMLAGSVVVTGWTLDDVGVGRVEIWRDLQSGEPTVPFASTPADPRNGKVFISNATFVDAARPDVEALNPMMPASYRAGWGYLMLTNNLYGQGNGTYKLYAFAFDQEDNISTIGTKSIVVNNNGATKPFGSIDTPAIGGDAGTTPNFGWALTPRVNGVATCRIPSNGLQVSIDSGPLQPVVYGDARTDVTAAFPGHANSAAAGAHFIYDWSSLSTGAHTIAWIVTDDCNRAEGIGSRFFNVTSGTSAATAPEFRLKAETTGIEKASALTQPSLPGPVVSAFRRNPAEGEVLVFTRGFNGSAEVLAAGESGTHTVDVKQGERIELRLPRGFDRAYQLGPVAERRPLPIGSTWDAAAGIFYWQPAPGFLGRYRLVFSNGRERISVRVVVVP